MSDLKLHHVAVVVRDVERSLGFYRDFLGLSSKPRPAFQVGGAWLDAGRLEVHLVAHPGGSFRSGPCESLLSCSAKRSQRGVHVGRVRDVHRRNVLGDALRQP